MKVKELITRLLDEPMDAEVCLQDPTEHMSNGTMCNGYLFNITDIEPWSKHRICINFKDWRTEEPKRMRGKWQEHKDYPNLAYLCSECGHFTTMRTNFCPSCGADMRGER